MEADGLIPRRWELHVAEDGGLAASLVAADPPIVVTADSLTSLRRQVTTLMRDARREARRRG